MIGHEAVGHEVVGHEAVGHEAVGHEVVGLEVSEICFGAAPRWRPHCAYISNVLSDFFPAFPV